jgi:hypothetical protein
MSFSRQEWLDKAYSICALFGKVPKGDDCIEDKSLRDVAQTISRILSELYDGGCNDASDNYECSYCDERYTEGYNEGHADGKAETLP